jgi:Ca-activated chloride channel family protein
MWTFEDPVFLLFLIPVPVLVYLSHGYLKRGGRLSFSFSIWRGKGFSWSQRRIRFAVFLGSFFFWLGTVLLIVGLSRPAQFERNNIYLSRGVDIMIVLAQSPSMGAMDSAGLSRFDAAREVIRKFVAGRENDPIGIVSFASDSSLRVPPTLDYPYILSALDQLTLMELGSGTAIGMGLAVACLHLRESEGSNKVIVLITDGENNAGEILPTTAADIAKELGIRIYSIGIGSEGSVPLEYSDPVTGKVYRGTFEGRFDEELLKRISDITGGKYFSVSDIDSLEQVLKSIDVVEVTERRVKIEITTIPFHRQFLLAGLILLLLSFAVRKILLREVV